MTQFNAQTGQDETVYYMTGVATADTGLVDSCLLVMKDWSGFLLLDPVEIDKERGVIKEERRSRRNLGMRLREQTDPYVFNHSKYATRNIIGSEEIIQNFTPDELRAYYKDFYRPDQQAVIVVGDVDAAKMERTPETFQPDPETGEPETRLVYGIRITRNLSTRSFDKEMTESIRHSIENA